MIGSPRLTVLAYADFEKQKGDQGGVFWCLSEDGLKWTEPRQLCSGLPVPLKGKEYVAHPTLMIDSVTETKPQDNSTSRIRLAGALRRPTNHTISHVAP